jgi:hypothetical protein
MKGNTSDDKTIVISERTYSLLDVYHRCLADVLQEKGLVKVGRQENN